MIIFNLTKIKNCWRKINFKKQQVAFPREVLRTKFQLIRKKYVNIKINVDLTKYKAANCFLL